MEGHQDSYSSLDFLHWTCCTTIMVIGFHVPLASRARDGVGGGATLAGVGAAHAL